jgi:chromatin remodeling complex protein RSC6
MDQFFTPLNDVSAANISVANVSAANISVANISVANISVANVSAANISATPAIELINNGSDESIETQFTGLLQELSQLKAGINEIFTKFRSLEKSVTKELKVGRATNKKKTANVKTGFDTPVPLSDELCKFIGLPSGSEMAYTEVTQTIMNYIQKHKLTQNRNEIIQDEALTQLFGPQTLTHFNLQKHISLHIKNQ